MIRASAKNFYYVSVLSSPNEYESFIKSESEARKKDTYLIKGQTLFGSLLLVFLSLKFLKERLSKRLFLTWRRL